MACGCNGKEAGFFDSGPYTPIANARFDGLGPGVREAGAVAPESEKLGGLLTLVVVGGLLWMLTSKP